MKKINLIFLSLTIVFSLSGCTGGQKNELVKQSVPESEVHQTARPQVTPANNKKVQKNVYLEDKNVGELSEDELMKVIQSFESSINKSSQNAQINMDTWEISNGRDGKKVDVNATKDIVMSAKEGEKVKVKVIEEKQQITAETLKKNIVEIGDCTTEILDQEAGRVKNIQLSIKNIDNKKLKPGEVFSFNNSVGERTSEKGYKVAPIITPGPTGYIRGKEIGGGVCQVSTTIYGAVTKAGLEVLERHEHTKDIHYAPKGSDATVSYPHTDFKFKNSKNKPISINIRISKNTLVCKIFENRN